MPELAPREIAALITAAVGLLSLVWAVNRFGKERLDTHSSKVFQSRDHLRQSYADLCIQIMELVGKLTVPMSNEDYLKSGYALEQIYSGKARLLPESGKMRENKFTPNNDSSSVWKESWEDDDGSAIFALGIFTDLVNGAWSRMAYGDDGADAIAHTPHQWQKLDDTSKLLATRLQAIIREEHNLKAVKIGKLPNRKESKSKAKE